MKKIAKNTSILLASALVASSMPFANPASAAAASEKVALSAKKLTITAGKTKKLKLKNNKKKVTWKVVSGKKNISLKSKKKTRVTIRAKKKGTAKVQAKIGKNKYTCKVTVKAKAAKKTQKKKEPEETKSPANIVSIDKSQLRIGMPLQVKIEGENINDVQYYWYIDDEMISDDSGIGTYVPKEQDCEHWIKVDVLSNGMLIGSDQVYFSKLPVIYIDTADGGPIKSKTEYIDGNMYIQGNDEFTSQYDGDIEIKGRGNSSWGFTQKPYKIKLDKSTDLFGFGKNKHWVLLSPYLDQSLMRNRIAYDLSGELGLLQMQITWADVILNGKYAGNYGLCEHIRVADSRIPIFNWGDEIENVAKKIYQGNADILTKEDRSAMEELLEENLSWITSGAFEYKGVTYAISDYYRVNDNLSGGYVFELSEGYNVQSKFTTSGGLQVMLDTPEHLSTNDEMFGYVQSYWQQFENSIRSLDGYNEEGKHYQELADFDSMVEYWLTMEIMGNDDGIWKSRYAYKDSDNLLTFGPVWDFDYGCGSITVGTEATGWKVSSGTLWKDFIDDPYFCVRAAEKYWSIRGYLEEIIRDNGMIDSYYHYLYESGHATDKRYHENTYAGYMRRGFDGDVNALKTYLKDRIAWLDKQFASTSSIVAGLRMAASAHPYIRSEGQLSVSLPDTLEDTISDNLKADGILEEKEALTVQVTVNDENTTLLHVYVNGMEYLAVDVAVGEASFKIDGSALLAEGGAHNVISLIGKDNNDNVTYTNFATVLFIQNPHFDEP